MMNDSTKLNIAVIYGSARGNRQGIKAARFVLRKLQERSHTATLIDPLEVQLPFLDRMYKEFGEGEAPENMARVAAILDKADAFLVVSAEYNHSEPAALKNLLDHYQSEYLNKPSGIVTYSAGPFGGVRALITLRAILAELGSPSIPAYSRYLMFKVHSMMMAMRLKTLMSAELANSWTSWNGTAMR